uniref:Uncharacterized protein n=1 Tax=Porphyridium sordidum TaxID=28024 RepID=A0A1C9CDX7_PORSO|nr:hypothetical protein Psor_128 [Porphyridium sordidum]AOM66603.1 hypothetical protein Psor_128 [Porphyridium sordidum]
MVFTLLNVIRECIKYYFVDKEHCGVEKDKNKSFSFTPRSSIVNANIYKQEEQLDIDWDVIECLSFIEKPGIWLSKNKS